MIQLTKPTKHYAVYMPGGEWKAFDTHEEAWDFIEARRCFMCIDGLKMRPFDTGGTSCDAEWDIWTQEEVDAMELGPMEPEREMNYPDMKLKPAPRPGWEFKLFGLDFIICGQAAGLFCVYSDDWTLHLGLPRRKFWSWGYNHEWELFIGAGPLFLFIGEF